MAKLERLVVTMGEAGGAVTFGVDRREVAPGQFEDAGVYWHYQTFVQARHLPADTDDRPDPGEEEQEDEVVGEQEEELVAAEAVVE